MAILVKGKSFVILYTDFSFKHLMENPLVMNFLYYLKESALQTKDLKDFFSATTTNCLKEKSVYKITKDFPMASFGPTTVYRDVNTFRTYPDNFAFL